MSRVLAVDLGSNTFRAIIYDCAAEEIVASYEKVVRTAQGVKKSGIIAEENQKRVLRAIEQMPPAFRALKSEAIAVTTQALRYAQNASAVLRRLEQEGGITFAVIDGQREAELTLLAVRRRLQRLRLPDRELVMVDIGGGSTEIVFHTRGRVLAKSFEVGIVTAAEEGIGSMEEGFAQIRAFCSGREPKLFVSTAGTPTTVAALKRGMNYTTYDPRLINGTVLTPRDLEQSLELLLQSPRIKREELVGVGRDDLIIAGIEIYKTIFEILHMSESVVIDDGLREGVAIDGCIG